MKRLSILLVAGTVAACGSSKPDAPPPKPQPPANPFAAGSPGGPPAAGPAARADASANPKFAILRPYFGDYVKRSLDSKVNVFKSNLAGFAPRVEIDEESEKPSDEPKTPLEYYDADSYKLVLIMSGTAQPKALLIDPREKSYIIQVGTKVGNRGGKVTSITPTDVRIEEPAHPPVVKSLESTLKDMERELQSVQEF